MQFESIPNQTTTYDVGRAHSAEEHIVGVCHPKHQKSPLSLLDLDQQ